jgi:hypothetical protein
MSPFLRPILFAFAAILTVTPAFAQSTRGTGAVAADEARNAVETTGRQAMAARNEVTSQITGAQEQVKSKLKLPFQLPKFEVPDVFRAARIHSASVDDKVTSPRTLTYKSRVSRLSRWIGPLTFGVLNYVPFETMNAGVTGAMNNLMAEQEISVEAMVADAFANQLKEGKRWPKSTPAEGTFQIEVNRYALDPVPTSLSRLRPTVSLTGRLYDNDGKLLWIGKGFTSSVEPGSKGATLEEYQADPSALRNDFQTAVQIASKRLAAQANAVPKATVKVTATE